MTDQQRQENANKYGEAASDIISQAYATHIRAGHSFCAFTAIKYLRRFVGNNLKAGNPKDLEKALDFITRMKEVADKQNPDVTKMLA